MTLWTMHTDYLIIPQPSLKKLDWDGMGACTAHKTQHLRVFLKNVIFRCVHNLTDL